MKAYVWPYLAFLAFAVPSISKGSTSCIRFLTEASKREAPKILAWREKISHKTSNAFAATNSKREAWIEETKDKMEKYLFSEEGTPEMEFVPAVGVTLKVLQPFYRANIPRIQVGGLGPRGILGGTMLLPVSGHCGVESARAWAKRDTYSLFLEQPDGNSKPIVKNVKSLGITTIQEVEIGLRPSEIYKISYHRSGSGGPSGYPSGRILEIVWDGS